MCPISTLFSLKLIPLVCNQVRFRQILKKHGLMAQAPETPRSQAQRRKAPPKPEQGLDDDEDGDSSYDPSPLAVKASARKRSAPGGGGRAKRQKVQAKSEDEKDDEETVAESVVVASTAASKAVPGVEANMKPNSNAEAEVKTEANGMAGAIDGTDSASPHELAHGEVPQGFSGGMAHLIAPGHRQSALSANMGDSLMMQLQPRHYGMVPNAIHGNDSFAFGQQLNPRQLAALQAHSTPRLQPQQLNAEQLQQHQLMLQARAQQFNRFQIMQMSPYQMPPGDISGMDMPVGNIPFGYMGHAQLNEQFPADFFNGDGSFFDQAQFGHDADDASFRGKVDGQDEWDVENDDAKKEVTPEVKTEEI